MRIACQKKEDLPLMFVEMSLLVEYLKISALAGDIDSDVYLVVKQSIPLVWEAYDHLLK
jgi:hypothetical protein